MKALNPSVALIRTMPDSRWRRRHSPPLSMNIPQLHVGAGTHLGALTVFPVWPPT